MRVERVKVDEEPHGVEPLEAADKRANLSREPKRKASHSTGETQPAPAVLIEAASVGTSLKRKERV